MVRILSLFNFILKRCYHKQYFLCQTLCLFNIIKQLTNAVITQFSLSDTEIILWLSLINDGVYEWKMYSKEQWKLSCIIFITLWGLKVCVWMFKYLEKGLILSLILSLSIHINTLLLLLRSVRGSIWYIKRGLHYLNTFFFLFFKISFMHFYICSTFAGNKKNYISLCILHFVHEKFIV